MKNLKEVLVFVASPAYAYREKDGEFAGQMLEKQMDQEFIADSYGEAVKHAIAWAHNRFEAIIKDWYNESFFSSIKVYVKSIGRSQENGQLDTHNHGCFFEWKYDWPGTLEEYSNDWVNGVTELARRDPYDSR
jgi:hypothetical protein